MKTIFPPSLPVFSRVDLKHAVIAILLLGGFALQVDARADDGIDALRAIHPYALAGATWDSNLFRVADSNEALSQLGTTDMSDSYSTLEAGFKAEIPISRQQFLVNGRIYKNNYNTFSGFDYTGGDAQALWNWVRGNLWSGNLGYIYNRRQRNFANQDNPAKDIRTENKILGSADRWLTDRWRLGVLGNWSDIGYDLNKSLDRKRLQSGIGIDYVTKAGNSVGFQTAMSNVVYANANSKDHREFKAGPAADWQVTGKTRIRAEASYLKRNYDDNSTATGQPDFSGLTGRLTATVKADDTHKIKASAYHEINNLQGEIANYIVVNGASIEPTWQISNKITLRGSADYERRDFKGVDVTMANAREDNVYSVGAWFDWNLYRSVGISLGYSAEKRTSNEPLAEYRDQTALATLTVGL